MNAGRGHRPARVGGECSYKILNVTPAKPVMIVRRMDYVYGDYELEFSPMAAASMSARARERTASIAAELAIPDSGGVRNRYRPCGEAEVDHGGRDVNMFHYWFFQRSSGRVGKLDNSGGVP